MFFEKKYLTTIRRTKKNGTPQNILVQRREDKGLISLLDEKHYIQA
jgi:hypothetical protein